LNTLIPLDNYATFYYNILLLFLLIVLAQSFASPLTSESNIRGKRSFGIFILIFVLLYIGTRPISFVFGDMAVYAEDFEKYRFGMRLRVERDVLFEMFMQTSSKLMSAEAFFFICAAIYILPLYFFSRKVFKDYWFYGFFILVISFSFFAYGTNGVRNGIATSIFLFALSRDKKLFLGLWVFLAISIHTSMIVPTIAYIISLFFKNTKLYIAGWVLAIPLSLILGSFWENFFMGLGLVEEQRVIGYLSGSEEYLDKVVEVKTGFRWDFLVYSATGVFAGWYYIVKKGFDDALYRHIFSIYLIANALWILVIRANFSNRIAFLSWFLLGTVIIYPLLKSEVFQKQHRVIGGILLVYFTFTYIMNVIVE
jgi:MFS family permease